MSKAFFVKGFFVVERPRVGISQLSSIGERESARGVKEDVGVGGFQHRLVATARGIYTHIPHVLISQKGSTGICRMDTRFCTDVRDECPRSVMRRWAV